MISLWGSQRGALVSDLTASLPPLWSFSRASQGTQVQSGVLSTANTNVARFETSAGYLNEPQETNIIRNNTMVGAVVGSPGTLPTNWNVSAPSGLVTSVAGVGTVNGINYIDLRFAGTTTLTSYVIDFEVTPIAVTPGQIWTESLWVSMIAGSLTNLTTVAIDQRFVGSNIVDTTIVPNATFTRYSGTGTAGGTATTYQPALAFAFSTGVAIDVTLRIGMPQAELSAFATSVVATTTAAATRAADNLRLDLTQLPNLQTPTGYGAALEFSMINNNQPSTVVLGASINTDSNNTWYIRNSTTGDGTLRITSWVAGSANSSVYLPLRTAGLINRAALSVTPAGIRWVLNGSAVTNLAKSGQPLMDNMAVGYMPWNTGSVAAMHATTVTLIPGPQSDAWLSAMAY